MEDQPVLRHRRDSYSRRESFESLRYTRSRRASSDSSVPPPPPATLVRQKSASDTEVYWERRLVEITSEPSPRPSILPRIKCELASEPSFHPEQRRRRVNLVFERRMRHTISVDARLLQALLLFACLSTAAGLSLGSAGPAARSMHAASPARAAAAQRTRPLTGFVEVDDRGFGPLLLGEHPAGSPLGALAANPTYPAPASSVASFEEATRHLAHERERLADALDFAAKAHEGQMRKSGEAFVTHPIAVASILGELKMDADAVIAGLLHDTVEDTDVTVDDVGARFGAQVARIVEGVTDGEASAEADNQRELLLAMAAEWRVVLVKLADRLHNMRTLGSMPRRKQRKKARETLQLFVPLACRVGVTPLEEELRRLSLEYLDGEEEEEEEEAEEAGGGAQSQADAAADAAALAADAAASGEEACPSLIERVMGRDQAELAALEDRLYAHRERWARHVAAHTA